MAGRSTTWNQSAIRSPLHFCVLLLAPLAAAAQDLGDQRLAFIEDPLRIEFGSSAQATPEQIRDAIGRAAAARDWQIANESGTRLELARTVSGKHQMNVAITHDAGGYSLRYLRSVNLLYREKDYDGTQVRAIHRNYNAWVSALVSTINRELGVAAKTYYVATTSRGGTGKAASATAAPIPDQLSITPPAASTPPVALAFAGAWQGKWGNALDHILIVERIEGRTISYVYCFGTSPFVYRSGFRRGTGTVDEGGTLRIATNNGTEISYEPSKDGQSLHGEFRQGKRFSSGDFKRRPLGD